MDKLLKRIADLILVLIALLGILNFIPTKIKGTDILIIVGLILFVLFVALITHHVSKLEEKIGKIKERFIRNDELKDIRKNVEALKLIWLKKK